MKIPTLSGPYLEKRTFHHEAQYKHSLACTFREIAFFSHHLPFFVSCKLFQLPLLGNITFVTGCKPSLLVFLQGDGTETKNSSVPVILQRSFWQSLTFPIADSFLETISRTCMDNLVNRQSALVLHLTIMLWLFASMSRKVTYHLAQLLLTTSSLLTTSFFCCAFQIVSHPSFWKFFVKYSQQMTYFMRIFLRPLAHACILCLLPSYSCSGTASGHSVQEVLCVLWACFQSINPWQTEMQSIKLHYLTWKTCTEPKYKEIQTMHLCSNTFLSPYLNTSGCSVGLKFWVMMGD